MPAQKVFLSIIIATFRRYNLLTECLESVLAAYLDYKNNGGTAVIEVVICNDDPSAVNHIEPNSLNSLRDVGIEVVYQINAQNLGDYFNRYNGIKLSSGKWIKFVDDDDLIYPWCISTLINILKADKSGGVFIFNQRENYKHLKFPIVLKNEAIYRFHYLEYGIFHSAMVNAVFLKEDVLEIGGFKYKRFYGDYHFYHEMAKRKEFHIYPIELGWYRIHDGQESEKDREKANRIRFNYLLYSYDFLTQNNFENTYYIPLRKYAFATIKYSIKHADRTLLLNSIYYFFLVQSKISDIKSFRKKIQDHWTKFYHAQMRYSGNEFLDN